MYKRGNWTAVHTNTKRHIARARRKGASVSLWLRAPRAPHSVTTEVGESMAYIADDMRGAILEALEWSRGETAAAFNVISDEADMMMDELERETPFDPEGPNDGPLHAAESWRMTVKNRGDTVSLSVSNPKFYVPWLEERGGRSDHPGSNDPGWINAAFDNFALGLRGRI